MVDIVPLCANCDHRRDKHQLHVKTGKKPCMFVKRNGRSIETVCDCTDYVDPATPAGAAILKLRAEKARAAKK